MNASREVITAPEPIDAPGAETPFPAVSRRARAVGWSDSLTLALALIVLAVIVAWALVPWLFTSYDPLVGIPAEATLPPSGAHLFGTDYLGRDVFARVVYGTGLSVTAALLAVAIGVVIGSIIGLAGGFFGGWLDGALGRVIDMLLAIPGFLLAVVIVAALGFATVNAAIAIGVSSIAMFARLMRSEVLRVKSLPYVESSFVVGGGRWGTLARHVLPNAFGSILSLAVLQFGVAVIALAGLAFLGYGNPPPTPEWGLLIAEGKNYLSNATRMIAGPGFVIVATVLSLNRVSQSLRRSG